MNGKYVIYYSGYREHISLHPALGDIEKSIPEVAKYRTGKGTLQFKLDEPLPIPSIRKIKKGQKRNNVYHFKLICSMDKTVYFTKN